MYRGNIRPFLVSLMMRVVLYLLQNLDEKKSVGPDGISAAQFLKEVVAEVVDPLTIYCTTNVCEDCQSQLHIQYYKGAVDPWISTNKLVGAQTLVTRFFRMGQQHDKGKISGS